MNHLNLNPVFTSIVYARNSCSLCGLPEWAADHRTCNRLLFLPQIAVMTKNEGLVHEGITALSSKRLLTMAKRAEGQFAFVKAQILFWLSPLDKTRDPRIRFLLPVSSLGQTVFNLEVAVHPVGLVRDYRNEDGYKNKRALVELRTMEKGTEALVGYSCTFGLELHHSPKMESKTDLVQYIQPGHLIESDHHSIKSLAERIKRANRDQQIIVRRILDFVASMPEDTAFVKLPFSPDGIVLRSMDDLGMGAVNTLQTHRASCYGYAQLMTALCRASQIPCRTVLIASAYCKFHLICEAYIDGYGWVRIDPSPGRKRFPVTDPSGLVSVSGRDEDSIPVEFESDSRFRFKTSQSARQYLT